MKRTLLFANVVLVALIALSVWLFRHRGQEAQQVQSQVLDRRPHLPPVVVPPSPKTPTPASPQNYMEATVQQFLFVRDRNPNVIEKPKTAPPPPAVPPFPAVYGLMTLGEPTLILSAHPGDPQKGYHKGDMVGNFKLVDFDTTKATLEWNGKTFEKTLTELAENQAKEAPPVAAAPVQMAATQAPARADNVKQGPGESTGDGERACVAGDTSPAGTVSADGYKKMVMQTPFGVNCRWLKQ